MLYLYVVRFLIQGTVSEYYELLAMKLGLLWIQSGYWLGNRTYGCRGCTHLIDAGGVAVKLAQSIWHSLWMQEVVSSSPISTNALMKFEVLEIPLDKELTANCLVETHTKLEELILAVMVLCMSWIGYSSPCGCSSPWLMVSHGMVCLGPQWSANICMYSVLRLHGIIKGFFFFLPWLHRDDIF